MNIHHLELFYYVAKYEGITEAVRKMPFGIQQPAVSGQLLQFEKNLGVKLFNRRPFALTPEGERLYDFAYPFFSKVPEVESELKGEDRKHLKLAASAAVLRTHLPQLLERMKLRERELRLTLRETEPTNVPRLLLDQQVDVAISALWGKMADALHHETLLSLPLVLRVPAAWKVRSLAKLVQDDGMGRTVGKVPLVAMPKHEVLMSHFNAGLKKQGITWEAEVEVGQLDAIVSYVQRGFGAGVGVKIPGWTCPEDIVEIPLKGFADLKIGLIWQGKMRPMAQWFLEEARTYVKAFKNKGKTARA